MRISDWSSDVCSSDLLRIKRGAHPQAAGIDAVRAVLGLFAETVDQPAPHRLDEIATDAIELAQPLAHRAERLGIDRKSVVSGKGVSVRVDLGGRRIIKKKKNNKNN